MKKLFIVVLIVLFCGVSVGFACTQPNCTHITNNGGVGGEGGQGGQGGQGGSATATGGAGGNASAGAAANGGTAIGVGSSTVTIEYQREMAGVVLGSILTELQFKYGKHTGESDSRISDNPNEAIDQLGKLELQEAIRGKGAKGDVKIIDSLIRPQFYKTTMIEVLPKGVTPIDYPTMRYLGSVTAVAAKNDVNFENVVCAAAEFGMENGATHMILTKTSFTEWGDTTGYSFELLPFITSILGGAGKNAMGVGAGAGAGMNMMTGGSADRPDAAFKFFVSQEKLKEISARHERARIEEENKAKAEAERKAKIAELQKQIDELKK